MKRREFPAWGDFSSKTALIPATEKICVKKPLYFKDFKNILNKFERAHPSPVKEYIV